MAGLVVGGAVAAKLPAKGGILVLLAKFRNLLIIPADFIAAWLKRKIQQRIAQGRDSGAGKSQPLLRVKGLPWLDIRVGCDG